MVLKNIIIVCLTIINTQGFRSNNHNWDGKWFPHSPSEPDLNPRIMLKKNNLQEHLHGIKMGIADPSCDDAKTLLAKDWFMDPTNFTCFDNKRSFLPKNTIHPVHSVEHIPALYTAPHKCMNESIKYNEVIPTFGTHRPLWAKYGEYIFVPRQRWVHNLEHGAVVMLYHPCANKNQVNFLRKIVRSCLYKHVITPYNLLTQERPLALVTWGHRLEMSKVAHELVVDFIKKNALKGPESTTKDGQYSLLLEQPAEIVSDIEDSDICPNQINFNMK